MEKIIGSFIEKRGINGEYQEKEVFVLAIDEPVYGRWNLPKSGRMWGVKYKTTSGSGEKYFPTQEAAEIWIQKVKVA